ncbi:20220_t:CDS:2 [Funneliformis geosporum]|nr:20220_t:CDS:2 [Funneliformis geosporum]
MLKGPLSLESFTSLKKINCSTNKITSLNLSDCLQLEELDCSFNKIAKIDLSNCLQLNKLYCSNNFLVGLDFSGLDPEKLTEISVNDNNFPKQARNHFTGSLRALEKLDKLEELDINNTDVDRGLEYFEETQETLDTLLETQEEIIQDNHSKFASKRLERLERAKKILSKKLTDEEIQTLLAEQEEMAKLEDQLDLLQQAKGQQNQPEQQAQILQPPYGTPGSS